MSLETRFADRMSWLLEGAAPERIGVAVSGGSDSTALMHLTADWAKSRGIAVYIATVDHGLRPEAAAEARQVRAQAEALGLSHATLRWENWDGKGNLQDAARRARRRLLWIWSMGLDHVLTGHTMDDQAETVLRNLARGSGVAGLSGMADSVVLPVPELADRPPPVEGVAPPPPRPRSDCLGGISHRPKLLRPLLEMRREELRDWLRNRAVAWSDDPSNEDSRFDRVRARKALAGGNALGLSVEGLAETARRQRRAREALERRAQEAAERLVRIQHGDVIFDRDGLAALEVETRLHLVAHALRWVSSSEYRPRLTSLEGALKETLAGRATTLHGCGMRAGRDGIRVFREFNAVSGLSSVVDGPTRWDNRWLVSGPEIQGCELRAAGEDGLLQMRKLFDPITPGEAPPHASLLAAPALFRDGKLVALPLFRGAVCELEFRPPMGGFIESLLSR